VTLLQYDTVHDIIPVQWSYVRWSRKLSSWKCARPERDSYIEK